jgi:hypothetical protein
LTVSAIIVVVFLLFAANGMRPLSGKVDKITWALFYIHHLMTLPSILFIKFPSLLLNIKLTDPNELMSKLAFRMELIPIAYDIFIVGQLVFIIYFIRSLKTKRNNEA